MGWPTLGLLHRCVTADGYAVQGVDMGSCPGLECVYEVGGGGAASTLPGGGSGPQRWRHVVPTRCQHCAAVEVAGVTGLEWPCPCAVHR